MKEKYFLYARKSTEDEERQVMSIEAQLAELHEYAKREKITIAQQFIENKSAKQPGREIFNQMIKTIYASNEPIGILAWHPDRLARNSVDGGQVIYLVDINKITSLKFPTFWFEPTPQGKFMLQVAFGQSKYYSDNLSENIRRGFRQKLRRGEWLTLAPLGYTNNPKTRTIEPDPVKSKIVQKVFEEYAQGKHTLESLGERLSFWGVVSRKGKPLAKSTLQDILTNKVYLGLIIHKGETYQGGFPPIVSPATFEKVQQVLKNRAKPHHSKQKHDFPFTRLLTCGECGGAITAQHAHGHGGDYRYYRCTKRLGPCSQRYLREDLLANQLKKHLSKVALCPEWTNKMLKQVDQWGKEETYNGQSFAHTIDRQLQETKQKLDKLVNAFLDNTIDKDTYLVKKEELITLKASLHEKKANLGRKGNNWNEPLREWVNTIIHAEKAASSNDFDGIKALMEKIGTNRHLLNQTVEFELARPFDLILKYKGFKDEATTICAKNPPQEFGESIECKLIWS